LETRTPFLPSGNTQGFDHRAPSEMMPPLPQPVSVADYAARSARRDASNFINEKAAVT
jgi:hypothetical protein